MYLFPLTMVIVHLDHPKQLRSFPFLPNATSVHKYCQPFLYIRVCRESNSSVCSMSIAIINVWFKDHKTQYHQNRNAKSAKLLDENFSQLCSSPLYAIVTHRTAILLPALKLKGPLEDVAAAAAVVPPPPPPPLPLSPVAAAPPPPKFPRAEPVTDENVSLLFCPVGCIRSSGMLEPSLVRSMKFAATIGPKNSRMKAMRRTKYSTANLITRRFRRRDCLIE